MVVFLHTMLFLSIPLYYVPVAMLQGVYYAYGTCQCNNATLKRKLVLPRIKLTLKSLIVGVVFAILIIAAAGLAWMKFGSFGVDPDMSSMASVQDIDKKVARYLEAGDTKSALNYYDEQIRLRHNGEEKQSLLVMKARLAQEMGQNEIAINAAKQADDIGSTDATIRALADAYKANGNNEQALALYKKLLKSPTQKDDSTAPRRSGSLEDMIKELE